jgi:hypothetical protein
LRTLAYIAPPSSVGAFEATTDRAGIVARLVVSPVPGVSEVS